MALVFITENYHIIRKIKGEGLKIYIRMVFLILNRFINIKLTQPSMIINSFFKVLFLIN